MSNFKVLTIQNLEEILKLEEARIAHFNEIEKMTVAWKAPWRKEALEHYLKTGWCIGLLNNQNQIEGYFLAQPVLFMESYTQSLWIEYISYKNLDMFLALADFAYKYGRDKHLQRVLFNQDEAFQKVNLPFKINQNQKNFIEVYTTKMS